MVWHIRGRTSELVQAISPLLIPKRQLRRCGSDDNHE